VIKGKSHAMIIHVKIEVNALRKMAATSAGRTIKVEENLIIKLFIIISLFV
jgi:hypothetical protein